MTCSAFDPQFKVREAFDPTGLDGSVNDYAEAPLEELGGIHRMVNRSDAAVHATTISGRVVSQGNETNSPTRHAV